MHRIFLVALPFLIFACNNKSDAEKFIDLQYQSFKEKLASDSGDFTAVTPAEFVAESHPDEGKRKEAAAWLERYNAEQERDRTARAQETDRRYDSLGGLTVIREGRAAKCNLFEGYYVLNRPVTDSASLAYLVGTQAGRLFSAAKKDPACTYPVMAQVFLYARTADYGKEVTNYVATCSITPSNYAGEVWVNKFNLKKEPR